MGGNNGSAVSIVNATWTTVGQVGNEIYINGGYTGGAANNGADPDNTARSSTGYIVTTLRRKPCLNREQPPWRWLAARSRP